MKLSHLLAYLLLLLSTELAIAGSAQLTWTAPTQNTDSTPIRLPLTYTVQWGSCVSSGGTLGFGTVAGTQSGIAALTYTVQPLAAGVYCFQVQTNNADGNSVFTSAVSKTILAPVPNPPGNLAVNALVAYTVIKEVDRFVMLPVGTVPASTACDAKQNINGYYVIPRASVTWSGNVQPDVVVAQCS